VRCGDAEWLAGANAPRLADTCRSTNFDTVDAAVPLATPVQVLPGLRR
jgi:hypothetical protein